MGRVLKSTQIVPVLQLSHIDGQIDMFKNDPDYQPDLYYYWDSPIEEDYNWRDAEPEAECLCEICFDILNTEKKIKWKCA